MTISSTGHSEHSYLLLRVLLHISSVWDFYKHCPTSRPAPCPAPRPAPCRGSRNLTLAAAAGSSQLDTLIHIWISGDEARLQVQDRAVRCQHCKPSLLSGMKKVRPWWWSCGYSTSRKTAALLGETPWILTGRSTYPVRSNLIQVVALHIMYNSCDWE